jgi:hypothetical protein
MKSFQWSRRPLEAYAPLAPRGYAPAQRRLSVTSYFGALALVVASSVMYHLSQKSLSSKAGPFGLMAMAYALAMILCLAAMALSPERRVPSRLLAFENWPVLVLGLAVAGIEIGVFMAYKSGLRLGAAPILINGAVALCLLPLDAVLFKSGASWTSLAGAGCILGGLYLLHLK